MKEFKGRAVIPGECVAGARVTHAKFDTYRALFGSLRGVGRTARCADPSDMELFGKEVKGYALCIRDAVGSELGSYVLYCLCAMERQPACILISEHIDETTAAAAALIRVWCEKVNMPVIDCLGDDFLDSVEDGATVTVCADGVVKVGE